MLKYFSVPFTLFEPCGAAFIMNSKIHLRKIAQTSISKPFRIISVLNHSRALYRPLDLDERTGLSSSLLSLKFRSPFFRCCIFHDQDFQLVHSGTVVFAARCYLPQKYFTIRRAFRQHKLTLETQRDAAAARKRSHQ